MTKPTLYRIQLHDGSPAGHVLPPERGLFELCDAEWRLHFRHLEPAIACGLLRSDFEIHALGRRRCLVTISGGDDHDFTVHLALRARADRVRADLERRRARLDRSRELLEAVERGEWWRDDRVFERFGSMGTISIVDVRYLGGLSRTTRVKSTRMAQVMDLGPRGISLRGWRRHLTIPWDRVASFEVRETEEASESRVDPVSDEQGTTVIDVHLHDGSEARFATRSSTARDLRSRLAPLAERLEAASSEPLTTNEVSAS